jgi:hypothetical protein
MKDLLDTIADPQATRDKVAFEYGWALGTRDMTDPEWPTVNSAIIERWSESGLAYIKNKAWRIVTSNARGGRNRPTT